MYHWFSELCLPFDTTIHYVLVYFKNIGFITEPEITGSIKFHQNQVERNLYRERRNHHQNLPKK